MPQHCLICNTSFNHWNNSPYVTHAVSHVAAKLVDSSYFGDQHTASIGYWYCKICGFRFTNRDKLQVHLMEQHKDMICYCIEPLFSKNESGECVFIQEYVDSALQRLLASFCTANPERPPDSELQRCTWGKFADLEKTETEECCICLTGLNLRPCVDLMSCRHKLHGRCLKEFVESGGDSCPICRVEFDEDLYDYECPDDPEFVL